jgi:glycosyltransferase involved in cell wall biosynthesis
MNKLSVIIMASVRWHNASAHYALTTANALKSAGFNLYFFGSPGSPVIEKAKQNGLNVIDGIDLLIANPFVYLRNFIKFRKLIRRLKPDIINTHFSKDHNFALLSMLFKPKKIVRTRSDSILPKNNFFNKILYKFSISHLIVPSEYLISFFLKFGISKNRISAIPPDFNYTEFYKYKQLMDLKTALNIQKNKIIVSYIGRLDKIKGADIFLKSLKYIKNIEKYFFIISGEEINLTIQKLKQIAKDSGVYNISFLNRMDDVRDILCITDIGIIPSTGSEAICRIGMEMISFGIPVIGSNINSIRELIMTHGGIAVNPGIPEEIASALDHLSQEDNYLKMKEKINAANRNRIPDKFSAELSDIFLKVAADNKRI